MKSCVLLFSGGIDSTNTLHKLLDENFTVFPLYVDYGQLSAESEITAVNYFVKEYLTAPLKIVKTNLYEGTLAHPLLRMGARDDNKPFKNAVSKNFLHFRNLVLACIAAVYSKEIEAQTIAFGFIKKETYRRFPDTSPDFVNKLNDLLFVADPDFDLRIITPFLSSTKMEVVKYGIEKGISLFKTYSCYEGDRCYKCESCLEVIEAYNHLSQFMDRKIIARQNPYNSLKSEYATR